MKIKSIDISDDGMQVVVLDDSGKPTTFTYLGGVQTQVQGSNDGMAWINLTVTPRKSEGIIQKLKNDRI